MNQSVEIEVEVLINLLMDIILGKWNSKICRRMNMEWEILVIMGVIIIMELIVGEEI
jgi:hypothetical protein